MRRTLLVGIREFRQRVKQRAFWFSTLALPVIMVVIWAATGAFGGGPTGPETELEPAGDAASQGVVDEAGIVKTIPAEMAKTFTLYPSQGAANQALTTGEIEAYYVVPANYQQNGDVRRVSERLPTGPADTADAFERLLLENLYEDADQPLARLRSPFNEGLEIVTLTSEGETEGTGDSMLPFLVAIVVMIPLFTSGSYLFQSLVQEKESRVLEILLLSLKPRQLLTGKLLGLGVLALVQYAAWIAVGALVGLVTGRSTTTLLAGINLTVQEIALIVPYALGGFALYAGLMAGIGALAPDMESSRMWIFVITLPVMIPIYLASAIAAAPNGGLATALSLIPFSAPVSMLIRMTATAVPAWQIAASMGLLFAGAAAIIWLMARLFRAQTLLSGEALSVRRFFSAMAES